MFLKKAAVARKASPPKKAVAAKKSTPVTKAPLAKKAPPAKKASSAVVDVHGKRVKLGTKTAPKQSGAVKDQRKAAPVAPQHRVYVIEVRHLQQGVAWDYYVGYTNNFFKVRWEKYEQLADSVSKVFRDKKVEAVKYRYDLMKGWGPYKTKAEAITAEGDLALYLEARGFGTYSDQLKHARKRREANLPMMQPHVPKKRRVARS